MPDKTKPVRIDDLHSSEDWKKSLLWLTVPFCYINSLQ